jgi:hypothetical protein
MQGGSLAKIRSGKWKLHVRNPGPPRYHSLSPQQLADWIDPRGPDGVILLAPYEQPGPTEYPGLASGDEPTAMMLFDLDADHGEQRDVSDQHPEVVERLLARFKQMQTEVPDNPSPTTDYLFAPPAKGQPRKLMRLIGGDLSYDRIPRPQQHLLAQPNETKGK